MIPKKKKTEELFRNHEFFNRGFQRIMPRDLLKVFRITANDEMTFSTWSGNNAYMCTQWTFLLCLQNDVTKIRSTNSVEHRYLTLNCTVIWMYVSTPRFKHSTSFATHNIQFTFRSNCTESVHEEEVYREEKKNQLSVWVVVVSLLMYIKYKPSKEQLALFWIYGI